MTFVLCFLAQSIFETERNIDESILTPVWIVYLWAEVLDADAYAAFQETSIFDAETAERIRKYIYSAGNKDAPDELFR